MRGRDGVAGLDAGASYECYSELPGNGFLTVLIHCDRRGSDIGYSLLVFNML